MEQKKVVNIKECSEILGVSKNYVYSLVRDGIIASLKKRGKTSPILISTDELNRYIGNIK